MSRGRGDATGEARVLMERVLRGGGSLAGEYPLLFGPRPSGEVLYLEQESQVRAACGLLVRELVSGPERLRVGLIGSVCTHPEHRGRGLASRLLERAEARLAELGCTLAVLWADDAGFYERRGWRAGGCELVYALDGGACEGLPGPRAAWLRSAAPDDYSALHRIYQLHPARVDRTREETCALLSGPGISTLVLERGRDIAAYACLGRGQDLAGCVHEWGGAPEDVLALVGEHHARRAQDGPIFLMTPSNATALHARLGELGLRPSVGILGMLKLLDPAAAIDLVRRTTRGRVRAGVGARLEQGVTTLEANFAGAAGESSLEPDGVLGLLAPARGERARIDELERALGAGLDGLPLPLYVWGLDSI